MAVDWMPLSPEPEEDYVAVELITRLTRPPTPFRYDGQQLEDLNNGGGGGFVVLLDSLTSSIPPTVNAFSRYDVITRKEWFNYSSVEDSDVTGSGVNWAALLLIGIVVTTIGGNVLVCLAVCYMRKLQNMFNYFLVSLALSDMLSATLVMPLSIARSAVEHLVIPKVLCVGWYSLDVLFTSSTIIHLCMISVDRYMTFTYPLRYGHGKKKTHTIAKIALVWIISFCIAGPLFVLSMWDQHDDSVEYKGCGPETPAFIISATVTSFYLPLTIMTVMYALTVRALQQQLQEQRRMTVTNTGRSGSKQLGDWTPGDTGSLQRQSSYRGPSAFYLFLRRSTRASLSSETSAVIVDTVTIRRSSTLAVPELIPLSGQRGSPSTCTTSGSGIGNGGSSNSSAGTVSVFGPSSSADGYGSTGSSGIHRGRSVRSGSAIEPCRARGLMGEQELHVGAANSSGRFLMVADCQSSWNHRRTSFGNQVDVTLKSPTSMCCGNTDEDTNSVSTPHFGVTGSPPASPGATVAGDGRFRYNRSFTFRRGTSTSSSVETRTGSRRSSTSPDKGRRAVQVLGILFVVFVACYLPFFAVYVVKGTCGQRCLPYLPPRLLVGLEWLAYSGSMLNPIIYHVFNPDFRRAFKNLIHCRCRRQPSFPSTASRQRPTTAVVTAHRSIYGGRQNGQTLISASPIVSVSPPPPSTQQTTNELTGVVLTKAASQSSRFDV